MRQCGPWRFALLVLREKPTIVELNEPADVRSWTTLVPALLARQLLRICGHRTRVVAYAIENGDLEQWISSKFPRCKRLSVPIFTWLFFLIWSQYDRVAFGTTQAQHAYGALGAYNKRNTGPHFQLVEALPSACSCLEQHAGPKSGVLFFGSLERRKGVHTLLQAMEHLSADVEVTIVGTGPLEFLVTAAAQQDDRVQYFGEGNRTDMHRLMTRAEVVVLPSVREDRWREQIGLPILEGLAHGCTIVTTTEGGMAEWLTRHGHHVTTPNDPVACANAIQAAVSMPLGRDAVLETLPERDGRLTADDWLGMPGRAYGSGGLTTDPRRRFR